MTAHIDHAPELDTLTQVLARAPRSAQTAAARNLINRIVHFELATGTPVTDLLDTVERQAGFQTAPLDEQQNVAFAAVGMDFTPLPLADRPSTRTLGSYLQLLRAALTTQEAAARLQVSDGRVRQRLAERTLLSVPDVKRHRLPDFQFTDDGELPGWRAVAPQVPESLPIVAVARFMHAVHPDLVIDGEPVSPRDWLLSGAQSGQVVELIGE